MNVPSLHTTGSRREDARLTVGRGQYVDDVPMDAALRVVFVRSPYASAFVKSVDVSAALALPGVVAVLTGADMLAEGFNACPTPFKLDQGDGTFAFETPRPFLVQDRVRFVGEPVAMVLADSFASAQDAADLVVVEFEDSPAVTDVHAAQDAAAPQVWNDRPSNIAFHWRGGDMAKVDRALASSHHVARLASHISRVAAMPLEPRAALAYFGADGRPVLHLSHQSPHQMRDELARLFKLGADQLRVIASDVGGSFGMKWGPQREEILVFWAALRLRRVVRWTAQRSESFLSDEHARDVVVTSELGLDAQGRFTALRVRYDVNVGAYMFQRSTSPVNNIGGIAGVYTTPAIAAEAVGIFTNTQSTAAYRGAGRPDATYAIERIIDVAAVEMGIDPAELRRRNLIPTTAMPYRTAFRFEYDCGNFESNLDKAMELAGYLTFPERREASKARGKLRGIGIAMPIEMAGAVGRDRSRVHAHPDGRVTLTTGTMSVGQGHETGFSRLVAKALGLPLEKVTYLQGDTDRLIDGRGNGGSSALIQGGSAVTKAVDDLIENGRVASATLFEAHYSDVEFSYGSYRVRGTDRSITLAELAQHLAAREGENKDLAGAGEFAPNRPTFPNGCHICEVEIDPETGLVTPMRYVSVEDVGRVLNPALVEGQIHGGVVQGIGQVLLEQIRYDSAGQLVTGSFSDYAMPRASDMPEIESVNLETPTALNPLGVKGVGEAGTVGALSATINAVCNALQPAGVRHLDMPATPMRVWKALRDAGYATQTSTKP
ncbi:xanthine dehydrogenase family protein molybdopterin-binding subunit [Variovorax saccharolyticus]|uniref:xanthine dehydrogenase family protein molybdopterin-binding subunit n=1 Tax=Variovorax saccharolyticus TaxID=3053516 RepID=UPI002575573E|nr:xanthine dehydrogenase family protein molybdopterin-binding subunit [Variovorax sp. J22R187]MDM0022210.1 xanthine dehydrogenase family protein molybdopterin-binding subunit [Variovorax sp. J22R187]